MIHRARLYSLVLVALLAITVTGCNGGEGAAVRGAARNPTGSGGGGGGGSTPLFSMNVATLPTGVVQNQAFSVTVSLTDPLSGAPSTSGVGAVVTVALASGAGTLSGTLQQTATAPDSVTFNDLSIDQTGTFQLGFTCVDASGPTVTTFFDVAAPVTLAVLSAPQLVIVGQSFDVVVEARDIATNQPVVPASGTAASIAPAAGATGTILSGASQTFNGATSSLTFTMTYSTRETVALVPSLGAVAGTASAAIVFDEYLLVVGPLPAATQVNVPFDVDVSVTLATSGSAVTPTPPLSISLAVVGGTGTLSNMTAQTTAGSSVAFTGLTYDKAEDISFEATATGALTGSGATTLSFDFDMTVAPAGPISIQSGSTPQPFSFVTRDGNGAPFTSGATDLAWQLVNTVGGAVVASNTASFSAGPTATVDLGPLTTGGTFRLEGSITSPGAKTATVDITVITYTLVEPTGTFFPLKSVRVGTPYLDNVSSARTLGGVNSYQLHSGALPPGLSLTTGTGVISGTPTTAGQYNFVIAGVNGSAQAEPYRCSIAVFSQDESEIVAGQNFQANGPYTVAPSDLDNVTFTSTFDGQSYTTSYRTYYPTLSQFTGAIPLYVHHRGRGFGRDDYDEFLGKVASWGVICVSIEDAQSFWGSGHPQPISLYDGQEPHMGMQSGGAFQEGVLARMIQRGQTPGDKFHGRIDPDLTFTGGHSRGGGATHGSHTRSLINNVRGVIYFMAFDLRYFSATVSGTPAPTYAVPSWMQRCPSLVIAAENDGDLVYPIGDQFIDRAVGPCTSVTVYGANHNRLGDTGLSDEWGAPGATISRAEQHARVADMVVAFIKRWSFMDRSLDGKLYGGEHQGSSTVGVCSWRNMAERLDVDDYQDGAAAVNQLGGANSLTGGVRQEKSIYPQMADYASLGLRHNVITFNQVNATYSTAFAAQDVSSRKRLIFRSGQTSQVGYDFMTFRVKVTDQSGASATVTLFDRTAPASTYLPDYTGTGAASPLDRFIDVTVPLTQFTGVNMAQVNSVVFEFNFASVPPAGSQFYCDAIRFE